MRPSRAIGLGVVLALSSLLGGGTPAVAQAADQEALLRLGQSLYEQGIGAGGRPLEAGQGDAHLSGADAACVRCHRASGMGSVEGELKVPPISGRYLFPADGDITLAVMDGHVGKSVNQRHQAYDTVTLARALAAGAAVDGRGLSLAMPRYRLQAGEVEALQAYLAQLSTHYSSGAEEHLVRLATVITPDIDPERRALFRQMLEGAVHAKNASTAPRRRYMASAAAFVTRSDRKWQLDVWELQGAPDSWPAQLEAHYRAAPPFALLSGLSDQDWTPVQGFCNRMALPCWFPSVAAPPADARGGYGLYFSAGVRLEAEVLADRWLASDAGGNGRFQQVVDASPAALLASQVLEQRLQRAGRSLLTLHIDCQSPQRAAGRLAQLSASVPAALWVSDGRCLDGSRLPTESVLSATLLGAGLDRLPAALKPQVRVLYPFELPERRAANLAYLQAWLATQGIPLRDEVMQSQVFFAVNFLTDVLQDMLDNLYRDYLVERAEDMLGRRESGKAEQESRDRQMLGRTARAVVDGRKRMGLQPVMATDARDVSQVIFGYSASAGTTVYPHLALGPHQRFASKGAYLAAFSGVDGSRLTPLEPWHVPAEPSAAMPPQ